LAGPRLATPAGVLAASRGGSKLVNKLRKHGHDPLAASPNSGVNTLTGEGLADAVAGAEVVVDVANAPAWDDAAVLNFFQPQLGTRRRRDGRRRAAPRVLSVVGADRLTDSGYLRAKLAQEQLVKAATVPTRSSGQPSSSSSSAASPMPVPTARRFACRPCASSPRRPTTSPPPRPTHVAGQGLLAVGFDHLAEVLGTSGS
jgi:hypothetical protein